LNIKEAKRYDTPAWGPPARAEPLTLGPLRR
jgi:hypothetical protein